MKNIPIRKIGVAQQEQSPANLFKIRRVQDIQAGKDLKQDLHRHDFYFILLLQTGQGSHEIDFTRYDAGDHSVFILRPGQVHQLELKAGSTGYLMEFNSAFYHPADTSSRQRFRKAGNKNYCLVEENRFKKLVDILAYLFQEYTEKLDGYIDSIKANLEIFFIEFTRQSADPKSPSPAQNLYTQERLEEFLELLYKHVTVHKQVSFYAGLMNLSAYQLNEITKAAIGKTPSEIINEQIILEAKRYLLATPDQIKQVADLLGYEDVSYFTRFFRKHTGYSPEAFRRTFG